MLCSFAQRSLSLFSRLLIVTIALPVVIYYAKIKTIVCRLVELRHCVVHSGNYQTYQNL